MAKGLCCAAAAAGDLGKALVVHMRNSCGVTTERCGVCEIGPTCQNPQKLGFRFRLLPSADCGLAGRKCAVTPAMIAQYNANRTEPSGHAVFDVSGTGTNTFTRFAPPRTPAGYTLPNP
jgi:hypothetical protein